MDYVQILGCGAALPVRGRFPSAQVVKSKQQFFLVDCGEGTQVRLREEGISFAKINHIFISHLHGDHYLGLVGLLSSFHLLGRKKDLHLYCPKDLKEVIEVQLKAGNTELNYKVHYHFTNGDEKQEIFKSDDISVYSFPLNHRIDCTGFLFQEEIKDLPLKSEKLAEFDVPKSLRAGIKKGANYVRSDGTVIPNSELTGERPESTSYAYCSDNRVNRHLAEYIKGVDYLYHESTFMDSEQDRAKKTFHSTAREAAKLARQVGVKQLILGHYSSRYRDLKALLKEAEEEFSNVILGNEGLKVHFHTSPV